MMRLISNAVVLGWALLCLVVAANSVLQMYTSFAPTPGLTVEERAIELAAIERVRWYWFDSTAAAGGMLATSAIGIVAIGWRRHTVSPGSL